MFHQHRCKIGLKVAEFDIDYLYLYLQLSISASHDKSLEIHWLTTPGLWNDSARRRGLSLFARKSYVPRRVVTSITMPRRQLGAIMKGKVSLYIMLVTKMYQIKQINVMWCTKPINAWFFGYYALIVLLWEAHSSLAIARELCFPKQHYESIVPSKPGINR